MTIPKLNIHPPLINTPCPAATTLDDLLALWNCPSTGAITTRTSLISGFPHDDAKNLYVFYESSSHTVSSSTNPSSSQATPTQNATLNSLGYSPLPLQTYLSYIRTIARHPPPVNGHSSKTIIISVTGSAEDVAQCYLHIARLQSELSSSSTTTTTATTPLEVAMEINLSCPNIPSHPPPAYSREALTRYLHELAGAITLAKTAQASGLPRIPVGLKTPPYTYETQFLGLVEALEEASSSSTSVSTVPAGLADGEGEEEREEEGCLITFLTATNTLGSCLAFTDLTEDFTDFTDDTSGSGQGEGALPTPLGTGGLAGAPLHPLALGNVRTLRKMLDERQDKLGHRVQVLGVGGVLDAAGYRRMRKAGADVVGLASGLLLKGVEVFGEIERGLGDKGW